MAIVSQHERCAKELRQCVNKEKALILQRFFKTGKGEYGEGDRFLGVIVPQQRRIAQMYREMPIGQVKKLLQSKVHEYRMTALLILLYQFKKANEPERKKIFEFYCKNIQWINNWDLVDIPCRDIVGAYLFDTDRAVLYTLAQSKNVWERRIAMVSTWYFISRKQYNDTLNIAKILLKDEHDLIHKAVGWMLREVGKRSLSTEEEFLKKYSCVMPRTMLRYAIERFPENKRKKYLTR